MSEKIVQVDLFNQYRNDMQRYGIYLSRKRHLCEYRDGMAEVKRKILFCLYNDFRAISHATKVKSAAATGKVAEMYHPHGTTAIYGVMKTMVNGFESYIPLLCKQGIFGNMQGDPASAERYTEVYLSKFALDCVIGELQDNPQVVDWQETYDSKHMEPEFLPSKVPLLLINGSFGIAVGIKVEIPRHNINEVIDATINLIHNPDTPVCLIPDHCQKCEIIDTNFKSISNKGFGSYTVRGVIETGEYYVTNNKGKTIDTYPSVAIRSLPDLTFLDTITAKIEELIKKNILVQVLEGKDLSTVDELNYVLVLKKGSDPNFVRDIIYKYTEMQQNCRVNFIALDGVALKPMRMSYKEYLLSFLEFRKETKFRLYCNELQSVQTRIHKLETYIWAISSGKIDDILDIIKRQETIDDNALAEELISKFNITELQAKFILEINTKKLSLGYLKQYQNELEKLRGFEKEFFTKLTDDSIILREIEDELLEIKQKYGKKRNCKVIPKADLSTVPKGEFKLIISRDGFVKKLTLNETYSGDVGRNKNDIISIIKGDNSESILLFDSIGKVYKLPISKISFTDKKSIGVDLRFICKQMISPDFICALYSPNVEKFSKSLHKYFLVTLSKNGYIKKMDLDDFITVPASGIVYSKLDDDDRVIDMMIIADGMDIVLYSDNRALRFNIDEIPYLKRSSKGSMGMKLKENEFLDGMSVITPNDTNIVVITEHGYINSFYIEALPKLNRAKNGSKVIHLSKGDAIKAIYSTTNKDEIKIVTTEGSFAIPVDTIPDGSSVSKGTRVITNAKINKIIKCSLIKN